MKWMSNAETLLVIHNKKLAEQHTKKWRICHNIKKQGMMTPCFSALSQLRIDAYSK